MKKGLLAYIILSTVLVGCIGGMAFVGYDLFFNNDKVMENLESMNKEEVVKWVSKNKLTDLIHYEYEYSAVVDEGVVISQSIEPNKKINEEFTITFSKGSVINLNVNDFKTKVDFQSFISQYPNVKVIYENDDKENPNSELSRFSKNLIDIKNDELTVFLSKGKVDNTTDSKDTKDDEINNKDDGKILIPNDLLGIEESKFIKKLNDLGFKNLKKDSVKYYSFTSKKDSIFSYDDGKFSTDKTINYAISLGDYVTAFNANDYNNKKLEDTKKVVDKYNELNAHITLNTVDKETTDVNEIGKVSNCKCTKNNTKSIITCDLAVKKIETINVKSYVGKQESAMINELKTLGFKNFNKTGSKYSTSIAVGSIITNDTGNKKTTETINYTVSLGQYIPNMNEYNGKTLSQAQSLINGYKNNGANITLMQPEEVETNEFGNGILFSCREQNSNTIITCSIAKNYTRYNLGSEAFIKEKSSSNYDTTIANLNNYFNGKFTNVHYIPVERAETIGTIVNVKVNGQDSYEGNIMYDSDVLIEIEICQTQRN